jgi:glutaminyl-peptide cyclotransferase
MIRRFIILALLLSLTAAVTAQDTTLAQVDLLTVDVLSQRPHATDAFTQGLLLHDGLLYESTGRYGESTVRAVDPETGEVIRRYNMPAPYFAEGLALVGDELYQLTWREGTAFVYSLEAGADEGTFQPDRVFMYGEREGWGLCYDGQFLYHSDGSNTIVVRNPETFTELGGFQVTLYGAFVDQLNELECVGDDIYANVWQSDTILRIDKATGAVNGVIDASGLLPLEQRSGLSGGAVLNGIAYDEANDVFLITGKLWPSLFEVRFVPVVG